MNRLEKIGVGFFVVVVFVLADWVFCSFFIQTGPFRETAWLNGIMLAALKWFNRGIHFLGLGIAIWAFLRCRKCGYLVIALYFALCIFSFFAMPAINRAIQAHHKPSVSEQTQKKINEAILQAEERIREEAGQPPIKSVQINIIFPLGPMILVVGLWLVARREKPQTPNTVPEATAAPPSRSDLGD
jgi:hypothetical protein